jgi:hypothetical protein
VEALEEVFGNKDKFVLHTGSELEDLKAEEMWSKIADGT